MYPDTKRAVKEAEINVVMQMRYNIVKNALQPGQWSLRLFRFGALSFLCGEASRI
jgi:hypothetical protein